MNHFLWLDLFRKKSSEKVSLLEVLKKSALFCQLSNSELKYLVDHVYERTYAPDEVVFEQGERGVGLYVIASGKIAIRTETANGKMLVTVLEPGSFFGELALVEPEDLRTASAVALEKSRLIGFFKPDLLEILDRRPAMGVKILLQLSSVLGRRLQETTEELGRAAPGKPLFSSATSSIETET